MLTQYSISDIITSNPSDKFYYAGTFEDTENPDIDWPHRHDFYSLVWFTDSHGINVIDFEEYEIKPNRLFLMQPNQVHNWSYSTESKGYILVFDKHLLKNIPLGLTSVTFFDLQPKNIQLLKPLFKNLIEASNQVNNTVDDVIISGIVYLFNYLASLLKELKPKQKVKPESALQFSKLISNTISKNISVKEYATQLNLTVDKLNDICKTAYGQNPKTIILDKKITEAKPYSTSPIYR